MNFGLSSGLSASCGKLVEAKWLVFKPIQNSQKHLLKQPPFGTVFLGRINLLPTHGKYVLFQNSSSVPVTVSKFKRP